MVNAVLDADGLDDLADGTADFFAHALLLGDEDGLADEFGDVIFDAHLAPDVLALLVSGHLDLLAGFLPGGSLHSLTDTLGNTDRDSFAHDLA